MSPEYLQSGSSCTQSAMLHRHASAVAQNAQTNTGLKVYHFPSTYYAFIFIRCHRCVAKPVVTKPSITQVMMMTKRCDLLTKVTVCICYMHITVSPSFCSQQKPSHNVLFTFLTFENFWWHLGIPTC